MNRPAFTRTLRAAPGVVFGILTLLCHACSGIESGTLWARRLPGAPLERDWETAVPLAVLVSGGSIHQDMAPVAVQAVDQDTVHRNTASCHHGPSQKSAIPVRMRAYYDDRNIYLRLTWPDLTPDTEAQRWMRREGEWRLEGGGGDGIALVFPVEPAATFTCTQICHLDDFTVSVGRFQEAARMRSADNRLADLWLWRADQREALDLFVDLKGMWRDDDGGPVRRKNSRLDARAASGARGKIFFDPHDEPLVDAAERILPPDRAPAEGTRLPAYRPLSTGARGSNIKASERYRNGFWEVTLVRELATGDPRDVVFTPGGVYYLGIAVMDDTLRNHHLADLSWTLKLTT